MYKVVIPLFLLLRAFCVSAQDWKPITTDEKFNFQYSGGTYATVWADSLSILDSSTALQLNTVSGESTNPLLVWWKP